METEKEKDTRVHTAFNTGKETDHDRREWLIPWVENFLFDLKPALKKVQDDVEKLLAITTPNLEAKGPLVENSLFSNVASSSAAPFRTLSNSSHDDLNIVMHLNGYLIPHASVDFKLHKYSKGTKEKIFNTQVRNPSFPIVLDQVFKVHNILEDLKTSLASFHLTTLENKLKKNLPDDSGDFSKQDSLSILTENAKKLVSSSQSPQFSPKSFLQVVEKCLKQVRHSVVQLEYPSKNCFPQRLKPSALRNLHFDPDLPEEVLLEFSVLQHELHVTATSLHIKNGEINLEKDSEENEDQESRQQSLEVEENYMENMQEGAFMHGSEIAQKFAGKNFYFSSKDLELKEGEFIQAKVLDQITIIFSSVVFKELLTGIRGLTPTLTRLLNNLQVICELEEDTKKNHHTQAEATAHVALSDTYGNNVSDWLF
eukprot:maker-scaffold_12-snap-gene-12.3-mRNA-1 protein AED:0.00 eAED:0.00 QI:48/0.66/0.5/1/1/1/4/292/425